MMGTRTRRVIAQAAAAALLVGGGVVLASPAQAASSHCSVGYFCIWRDKDFQTDGVGTSLKSIYYSLANYAGSYYSGTSFSANDSASSFWNRSGTSQSVYIYKYADAGGVSFKVPAGSGRNNLATSLDPALWNDTISSAYFQAYDPHH